MKFTPSISATEIDWARLAAYIDGEGCISVTRVVMKGKPRLYLQVVVTNCDFRLLEWIGNRFGGAVQERPTNNIRKGRWSRSFRWITTNKVAAKILEGCLPFFVIKREQAEIGLAHQRLCGYKAKHSPEVEAEKNKLRDDLSIMKGLSSRRKDLLDACRANASKKSEGYQRTNPISATVQ
jgi:hypothetical protein